MLKTEERLEYSQLLDEFILGCKTDEKIGMEYERIPVSYYGKNVFGRVKFWIGSSNF